MKKRSIIIAALFIFSIADLSLIAVYLKAIEGERITLLDGLYWVITTMTTVGYGDIVFTSHIGKVFSMFVQLYGIGFLFGVAFPYIVIPWAERRFLLSVPKEVNLSRHIVVFGYTRLTPFLCRQLESLGLKYVIVESARENAVKAMEMGYNVILSEVSEEVIRRARIGSAMAIVVMWDDVERSLDVLLTLKDLNIQKIAILSDPFYAKYLHYAGVTKVITPKSVAGAQLAKFILERERGMLNIKNIIGDHGMTEIIIPKRSLIAGMTVGQVEEIYGIKVIAVCEEGRISFRPGEGYKIREGNILLVFGDHESIMEFYGGVYR
ncbi:K+ transport system, NAD-binding component [Geoglobus ahangari]|uniref:K+ transport system, NAD-binding component n=1 Tax=Geoglobus ahangari TaxID=113653 RepID=A0A0F7IGH6_9EURY|nr:potassium channel protein [Geoglobus ahangari]AKG91025.1 K+ transport system, NAD-binding component [Geoglobus ahangari]NOY10732.1 potassium channel protein [Archaeoglobi archaeon]